MKSFLVSMKLKGLRGYIKIANDFHPVQAKNIIFKISS